MTIESCQSELSIVPGKVQYQNQTANTKQVTEKEEQAKEPLLEKLRFHVNTQDSKLISITKSFRSPEQFTQLPGVEL